MDWTQVQLTGTQAVAMTVLFFVANITLITVAILGWKEKM